MTVIDFGAGARDDGYPQDRREAGWYAMQAEAHRFAAEPEAVFAPEGFGTRIARLLNYLGAVVSVMLMIGLMVWGWRLVTRDVSTVPVIRALAGESRVAPDNPGGEATTHTGLAVNEVPAGVAAAPAPEIAIAPATVALAEEDVPMGELGATTRTPGALSEVAPQSAMPPVIAMPDAEAARLAAEARAAEEAAAALALASTEAAALPPAADAPVDQAVTDLEGAPVADQANAINAALAAATDAPAQAAPVAASPRPAPRPQRLAAAAPAPAEPASAKPAARAAEDAAPKAKPQAAPEPSRSVTADSLPSGSTVVQIGAFDSDELARGEWSRVAGKNPNLFDGKSQIVQKTEKNGRAFWRLRVAGFGSRDEARAFCASLKASGTDCIPTAAN